jgi:hypothetical protein
MTDKKVNGMIEKERSTGQKVARGFGIALIVIAAFWGVFAAPLVAITVGAMDAAIGYLIVGLFFFSGEPATLVYRSQKKGTANNSNNGRG